MKKISGFEPKKGFSPVKDSLDSALLLLEVASETPERRLFDNSPNLGKMGESATKISGGVFFAASFFSEKPLPRGVLLLFAFLLLLEELNERFRLSWSSSKRSFSFLHAISRSSSEIESPRFGNASLKSLVERD